MPLIRKAAHQPCSETDQMLKENHTAERCHVPVKEERNGEESTNLSWKGRAETSLYENSEVAAAKAVSIR